MVHISFWFMLMMLILEGSRYTIEKNAEALIVASKETGLDVNADKTKLSCLEIRMQAKS